ncbi:MAG: 6-carboxyhexanoate--CoA ligase [Nitrospirae bacterium YQR-1]
MTTSPELYSIRMRAQNEAVHVSGAEDIVTAQRLQNTTASYLNRALMHQPEKIVITVEKIESEPLRLTLLPVVTCDIQTAGDAPEAVKTILSTLEISDKAVCSAISALYSDTNISGAYIISAKTGKFLCSGAEMPVRVSRFGLLDSLAGEFADYLKNHGLTHYRVKEALLLASKVCSCDEVVAEICVSDDPEYSTGYVASKRHGYIRIPNIKEHGNPYGGRVIFLTEDAGVQRVRGYLEKTPALFDALPEIKGVKKLNEIIGSCHS